MANPAKNPGVWGIDLGQCALKAIRLEEFEGAIKATAFDYIEHPKILSQPDADPDQLTREALEKFLSRNDIKGDTIAISVPGQSGLARFVKLPPVDEKKIPDIVRFEAKQQIPFPLEEVVWAYQRLGAGMMTDGMVLDTEIGLFAMKRDMVNRYLQHFKDVNVEIHVVQMAPLALCNFLAHDRLGKGATRSEDDEPGDKSCVVALDIGADNSNLVITDGEKIIWQRPIPLGGNHFTRALTKDLKLTFAKAEHLKRNAVKSPDLKKILAALKPVLNDFVSEVQRSLGYFTNTHRDATIKYMLGLGNAFRLPGLQKYLQEKLQLEVHKLQKIERLGGDEAVTEAPQYVENVLSFAVAHGLALQGLKTTRLYTNLLPPEIQFERFVRAKKPWAVAAAALLLLLVPPLMIGYAAHYNAWSRKSVKEAADKLHRTVESAQKDVSQYNEAESQIKDSQNKMTMLAGGVQERLNWLHLNTFINEALPRPVSPVEPARPDTVRLVPLTVGNTHAFKVYFKDEPKDGMSGEMAGKLHQMLHQKIANNQPLTPKELEEDMRCRKYLVQVNIEGVSALYSDDVIAEFFNPVLNAGDNNKLLPLSSEVLAQMRSKDSKVVKAGWIVEVRGYTYHYKGYDFVLDSFVANLMDLSDPDPKNRKLMPAVKGKQPEFPPDVERILRKKKEGGTDERRIDYICLLNYVDRSPFSKGSDFLILHSGAASKYVLGGGGAGGFPGDKSGSKGGPSSPNSKGTTPPADEPKDKVELPVRTSWKPPSGTGLAEMFGAAGAAGFAPSLGTPGGKKETSMPGHGPGLFDPGKKGAEASKETLAQLPPRTEFIVVFVWQEPWQMDGANPQEPNKQ